MNIDRKTICLSAVLGVLIFAGCSSTNDKRNQFKQSRDFHIGRDINTVSMPFPDQIVLLDEGKVAYYYSFFNSHAGKECRLIYIVADKSYRILSWEYLGSKEACYQTLKLGTPW